MKRKKMRLDLGKLTVVNLDSQTQEKAKGGVSLYCTGASYCCTVGTYCCTINVATCIPDPEGCNPADTFGADTICP